MTFFVPESLGKDIPLNNFVPFGGVREVPRKVLEKSKGCKGKKSHSISFGTVELLNGRVKYGICTICNQYYLGKKTPSVFKYAVSPAIEED